MEFFHASLSEYILIILMTSHLDSSGWCNEYANCENESPFLVIIDNSFRVWGVREKKSEIECASKPATNELLIKTSEENN